jgi:hypothetical protein
MDEFSYLCFEYLITLVCENSRTGLFTASTLLYIFSFDGFVAVGGPVLFSLFYDHAFWRGFAG